MGTSAKSAQKMGTTQKQRFQVTLKHHDLYRDDMIRNPEFSDVTLVSSDDKFIQAHRIFLNSQSSFFKKIFKLKSDRDIIIFLPNTSHEQLQSLLEYMYLGNIEIEENNLENFVQLGKQFGVKGFEDVDINSGLLLQANVDKLKDTGYDGELLSINMPKIQRQSNGKYSCDQCEYEAVRRGCIKRHKESVHLGAKYKCNECTVEYGTEYQIKHHINSVHNGQFFICDICEKKFNQPGTLNIHKKRVHEGLRDKCKECDKTFTDLAFHVQREHRNETFPCDQCKYIAKVPKYLKWHKKRKHMGIIETEDSSTKENITTPFIEMKNENH